MLYKVWNGPKAGLGQTEVDAKDARMKRAELAEHLPLDILDSDKVDALEERVFWRRDEARPLRSSEATSHLEGDQYYKELDTHGLFK